MEVEQFYGELECIRTLQRVEWDNIDRFSNVVLTLEEPGG